MKRFYKWALRKYLIAEKIRESETLVIAIKEEVSRDDMEELADVIKENIGDKVVIIGGVNKIIVAN